MKVSTASSAAVNFGFTREDETETIEVNLHSLFSQQAAKFPQNIAVEYGDVKISYADLERRTNQFARVLQTRFDIKPENENVVAVLLPRCSELYFTMLAVLKCGGAYVCIDPQHQRSRLEFILQDTNAVVLVTTSRSHADIVDIELADTKILDVKSSSLKGDISLQSDDPVEATVPESNLCYIIIYTSGSTGKPKGVEIEHRTVVNFINGELEIFPVCAEDRILQGFSPSFDASVEEIWLALSTGATLVAASCELMQSGPDLPSHLLRLGITVFSTVPTLLRTINVTSTSLPKLKLLILGGDACGEDLVVWAEGRMLVNSYGPTETTVVATACIIEPNKKITIGNPLKNYSVYVLDDNLDEVKQGDEGELCIGGKCLARGYRNLPEKSSQQFITHAVHGKIYRTGDLARFNTDADLEYLGRIDDQVKIRGFRVEIGSIEAHLQKQENVKLVAVVVTSSAPGQQFVVAHMTLEDKTKSFDAQDAVTNMKKSLPEYMIPNGYVIHDDIPTLASGKTDKKKLIAIEIEAQPFHVSATYVAPRDDREGVVCKVWESKLCNPRISIGDNFFELGGQSVVAAMVVSELRKKGLELSVRDLYVHSTIAGLAEFLKTKSSETDSKDVSVHISSSPTSGKPRYILCLFIQAIWLFSVSGSASVFLFYLVLTLIDVYPLVYELAGVQGVTCLVTGVVMLAMPLYITTTILWAYLLKKTLIGRVKPGAYTLWSMYYVRWWIVEQAKAFVPTFLFSGTSLMNAYARIMGAKVGEGVYYGSSLSCDFSLVEVGSGTSLEHDVMLATHRVDKGTLFLGRIIIEENCSIGARSVITFNSTIRKNSRIEPLTLVPDNTVVDENSHLQGSPASNYPRDSPEATNTGDTWKLAWWVPLAQFGFLGGLTTVFSIPYFCLFIVVIKEPYLTQSFESRNWLIVAMVIPPAALFVQVTGLLLTSVLKWFLVGRLEEGNYSINSWVFIRYWIMEKIMQLISISTKEIFATLYTNIWLKTLGMKIGSYSEISTAFNFTPDLVQLKKGSFVSDHVSLGGATFKAGSFYLGPTCIGERTFLGNNCVIKSESSIGNDVLIGVMSSTPDIAENKTSWLGSPPFLLPVRAISNQTHPTSRTFNPPWYLYFSRLIWEFFKLLLPPMLRLYSLYGFWVLIEEVSYTYFEEGTPLFWVSVAFWEWSIVFSNLLFVVLSKWILIGRFHPSEHPLWSSFVWRSELVASLEESVAMPMGLSSSLGTPFICWWYRALGAKIGKRVYLDTIYLTEADLIEIGDESCIAKGTTIQSHLFEDRVMKMDRLRIGDECTVCTDAIVLYGAKMENRCTLMPLSLCMKSETLESDSVYCGIPAQKVAAELHHGYHIDWQLTRKSREQHVWTDDVTTVALTRCKRLESV